MSSSQIVQERLLDCHEQGEKFGSLFVVRIRHLSGKLRPTRTRAMTDDEEQDEEFRVQEDCGRIQVEPLALVLAAHAGHCESRAGRTY